MKRFASGPSMKTTRLCSRRTLKIGPYSRSSGSRIDSGSCAMRFVRARLKSPGPGGKPLRARRSARMSPSTRATGLLDMRGGAWTLLTGRS